MRISDWSSDVCSSDLRSRERDAAMAQFVRTHCERGDRAVDRRLADPAGAREPFAQPHDPREGVDDGEAIALHTRDQQETIGGAEVKRGIMQRTKERRVGKECVYTCKSRW